MIPSKNGLWSKSNYNKTKILYTLYTQISLHHGKRSNWLCKITSVSDPVHSTVSQIAKFMGPTWVLSAPDGPHVGPMNLAIRDIIPQALTLLREILNYILVTSFATMNKWTDGPKDACNYDRTCQCGCRLSLNSPHMIPLYVTRIHGFPCMINHRFQVILLKQLNNGICIRMNIPSIYLLRFMLRRNIPVVLSSTGNIWLWVFGRYVISPRRVYVRRMLLYPSGLGGWNS